MKRRDLLKQALAAGTLLVGDSVKANGTYLAPQDPKRVFRIAHITDVHMTDKLDAPARTVKCLEEIKTKGVDFFLNGGDSLYGNDYDYVQKETVNLHWSLWKESMATIRSYEMYSCIGNHDPWWGSGPMNGKEYVVKQFKMPYRYYSFNKKNWHFIVLDSTISPGSTTGRLDDAQRRWLEKDLACLASNTPVLVLSHFPILSMSTNYDGGNHEDAAYITDIFYKHRDKKIYSINGHIHLLDKSTYNGVKYFNNGALSGNWWIRISRFGDTYCQETPPGYAILDLYEDGTLTNEYIPHHY